MHNAALLVVLFLPAPHSFFPPSFVTFFFPFNVVTLVHILDVRSDPFPDQLSLPPQILHSLLPPFVKKLDSNGCLLSIIPPKFSTSPQQIPTETIENFFLPFFFSCSLSSFPPIGRIVGCFCLMLRDHHGTLYLLKTPPSPPYIFLKLLGLQNSGHTIELEITPTNDTPNALSQAPFPRLPPLFPFL